MGWGSAARALLVASGLLLPLGAHAHFQARSPAACASAELGNPNWVNPDRAVSGNDAYATSTVDDNQATDALDCTQYGFTIPAGATVLGIIVRIERSTSAGAGGAPRQDAAVRVLKGGVAQPADRSTTTPYTTADIVEDHGTSSDLWGTAWTAADVNNADFGGRFQAFKNGTAGAGLTISVDHMQIEVHYSEPPPAPVLVSPPDGATVATSSPPFDWSDVTDPDGDTITYEMQADDSCAFASPEVNQSGLAASAFTPGTALANGTYCWRARAVDEHGMAGPWSATRNVMVSAAGGTSGSQTMSPNACTTLGGGGENWTNPGNAQSSNDVPAIARVNDGDITDPLQCLDYAFTIPPNAIILGIEVRVERHASAAGSIRDNTLLLVKAGAAVGANGATSTFYPAGDTVEAHGSASDMWGATWTPAEINAAGFGAVYTGIKPGTAGGNVEIRVDHIEITVHYSIPPLAAPGSFNAFDAGTPPSAITGVIRTKIAGAAFSLEVVAIASGAQLDAFTDTVTVELLGNNTPGVALDANNCPVSFTTVQTVAPTPTISTGRSTVDFAAVPNSWRDVRVRMRHPAGAPTVTSCSTDNFAIRPSSFAGFTVSDTDWQSAGTGRTLSDVSFGALVHKAGRPFSVRASAVNAAGAPTVSYSGTPTVVPSACAGAACTASFGALSLNAAFAAGLLSTDLASYADVGSFRLQLLDDSFASVDAGDSTPAERDIASPSIDVGRFVPDHFALASSSITPRSDIAGCASNFTYLGEPMDVQMSLEARSSSGSVTPRYAGTLARLDVTSGASYNFGAIDSAAPTLLTGRVTTLPIAASWSVGLATITAPIAIARAAGPDGPFTATRVGIAPVDADGVALGAFNLDADNSGSNERSQVGTTALRFGRLRLENATGSEKLDLPIPIQAQYWSGTAFQTSGKDNCTTISAANVGFSSPFGGITATNMNSANISGLGAPFVSGVGSLTLTKPLPAPASAGAVTVTIDLTAEAKSYLKGNWGVPTFTADPRSRAAFGLYGGQPKNFIYFRENY